MGGGGASQPATSPAPSAAPATPAPDPEPSIPVPSPPAPWPPGVPETDGPPASRPQPTVQFDDKTVGDTHLSNGGRTGRNGPAGVTVPGLDMVAGGELTLTGDGWLPGSVVSIYLFSTPVLLGTSTVDEQGTFTTTVRVPLDTATGPHTLVITGLDEDGIPRRVTIPIKILAAAGDGATLGLPGPGGPPVLAATSGQPGPLAQTGGGLLTLGTRAVLLLLLGGAALRSSSRRSWLRAP